MFSEAQNLFGTISIASESVTRNDRYEANPLVVVNLVRENCCSVSAVLSEVSPAVKKHVKIGRSVLELCGSTSVASGLLDSKVDRRGLVFPCFESTDKERRYVLG